MAKKTAYISTRWKELRPLARCLLPFVLMVFFLTPEACVVPPPPLVQDNGNTTPKILLGSLVPASGGTTAVTIPGGDAVFTINGQVIDPDPQRLTARFFFDGTYDTIVPFAGRIPAEPSFADGRRNFSFEFTGICDQVDRSHDHLLELYVSDTGFTKETGREIADGGGRDSVVWRFKCDDFPGDGGI